MIKNAIYLNFSHASIARILTLLFTAEHSRFINNHYD